VLERAGARRYWLVWAAVIPIGLWAVMRLFGLERGFPLVPLIAYTPYVAIAALFATGIAVALRNWAAATVATVAMVCLAVVVVPRAVGGETVDGKRGEVVTLLSANIHHGTADPDALVDLVRQFHPDLLSVQELTPRFAGELREAGIDRLLPEAILAVERDVSGAGLYAHLPLTPLSEPTRFHFRMPRAAIRLPGGNSLRVVGVHPYPPLLKKVGEWRSALESLPPAGSGTPWVLIGDFNATLDHAELRDVIARGYRDAADATGQGLEPTWPASGSRSLPVTIDHVLADERLGIVDYDVEDLPGSDHRAVYARLALP
jgi:endonuclease/exonuclease/phosphatase (EEP) superfamily protein YafD